MMEPEFYIWSDYLEPRHKIESYTIVGIKNEYETILKKEYFVPEVRLGIIPFATQMLAKEQKESEKFDKATSVFKGWKKDNPGILKATLKYDFSYWKVPKFIKDKEDAGKVAYIIT